MSSLLSEYQETPAFFIYSRTLFFWNTLRIVVGDCPPPICVPFLFQQEIVLQFASSHIKKKKKDKEGGVFKSVKVKGV